MSEEMNNQEKKVEKKKKVELEKVSMDRLRGRIIILNPEESEFAQKLKLNKKADYFKKK